MKSSKLIPVFVKKLIRAWYSPYLELRLHGNLNIFANVPLFTGYNMSNILAVLYVYIFVTGLGYASYFKAMTLQNQISIN